MYIIDNHCDTLTKIMEKNQSLRLNSCHCDLTRMKGYDGFIQFFAAFIDTPYAGAYAMKRAIDIIDRFYMELDKNGDILMLCKSCEDMELALQEGKVGAFLSIEGGEALQGSISALRMFYKLGVRSLCLTWNHRNEIADGVLDGISGGGLTPFGREVINEMNRLGMIIDISHISEQGFWDVIELSSAPVIASHSNSYSVCPNIRNLKDSQVKAIVKSQGIIGINMYPLFLNGTENANVEDVIRHIEYFSALGAFNNLALGADFDGIGYTPADISSVEKLNLLFEKMSILNYSDDQIQNFAGRNMKNFIKKILY